MVLSALDLFKIPTGYSSQMLWDENMGGKYVGKIQGENMSRKYFGKICGETCRENMWGKIFHRFAGPNIKDDKYTSVLYSVHRRKIFAGY